MDACPKCGSKDGYSAKMTMNYTMCGSWGQDWETTGLEHVVYKSKTVKCDACGHRVQLEIATGRDEYVPNTTLKGKP